MKRYAQKDSTEHKRPIDTEIEHCNCSLCPHDVVEPTVAHDFNAIVNTMKHFSDMLPIGYLSLQSTEQAWQNERLTGTMFRTKRKWEEVEAIRRLRLETSY
jgi:predicted PP-loop superfamily ATPase